MKNPRILSVSRAVPPARYEQREVKELMRGVFAEAYPSSDLERLLSVFDNAGVGCRHLAVPFNWITEGRSFVEKNGLAVERAVELSTEAGLSALSKAGVGPEAVDDLILVSNSAISSLLSNRLHRQLGLSAQARRTPILGRGCAGGVMGLSLAMDTARLERVVMLVVTELCSLTFVRSDLSKANLLSSALFGDGSAAIVLGSEVGTADGQVGPELLGAHSTTWEGTDYIMGFTSVEDGLKVDLSPRAPSVVRRRTPENFKEACQAVGLDPGEVRHYALHPGGPKILTALQEALQVEAEKLRFSREILSEYGNMSAPTALFVLERLLTRGSHNRGDYGVVSAMGPGFSAEHVFFRF